MTTDTKVTAISDTNLKPEAGGSVAVDKLHAEEVAYGVGVKDSAGKLTGVKGITKVYKRDGITVDRVLSQSCICSVGSWDKVEPGTEPDSGDGGTTPAPGVVTVVIGDLEYQETDIALKRTITFTPSVDGTEQDQVTQVDTFTK